jgi:hypothetical protein
VKGDLHPLQFVLSGTMFVVLPNYEQVSHLLLLDACVAFLLLQEQDQPNVLSNHLYEQ